MKKNLVRSVRHMVVALLCMCAESICAQSSASPAVSFLALSPDVKSAGMGGASCGISVDPSNGFTNTAKILFLDPKTGQAGSTFIPFSSVSNDAYMASIGYVYHLESDAVFVGLRYFSHGQATLTDINNTVLGVINPNDIVLQAGYAMSLSGNWGIATTFGYVRSSSLQGTYNGVMYNNASAAMVDVSVLYNNISTIGGTHGWSGGLQINNIGTPLHYAANQNSYLPGTINIGLAYTFSLSPSDDPLVTADDSFTLAADAGTTVNTAQLLQIGHAYTYAIGAEYLIKPYEEMTFSLRAGYRINIEAASGPTAGIGLEKNKLGIQLAYYFVPNSSFAVTGNTIQVGITCKF